MKGGAGGRRAARALAASLAAVALGGCAPLVGAGGEAGAGHAAMGPGATTGAGGAGAARQQPGVASTVVRADRTHEVPTPARAERAAPGWPTPQQAVRAFAGVYVNWTAATVSARLSALARRSVGQARAMLQLQAREVASDVELHRGRIANSGTVEAVAALAGRTRRYVVVTRERTSAADDAAYRGLAPEWHVSVATVERIGRGWVVSGWQPES